MGFCKKSVIPYDGAVILISQQLSKPKLRQIIMDVIELIGVALVQTRRCNRDINKVLYHVNFSCRVNVRCLRCLGIRNSR